jgi:phosphatidylserine/phosphatidylglycerophosphate/cardiolipin synthase-like enzyme
MFRRLLPCGTILLAALACACSGAAPPDPEDGGIEVPLDGGAPFAEDGGRVPEDGGAPPPEDGGPRRDGGDAGPTRDDRNWGTPAFTVRAPSDLQEPALRVNAYFTPSDDSRAIVLRELDATRTKLHSAMFSIGDARVTAKLIAMQQAGIEVRILWDKTQAESNRSDDHYRVLVDAGVNIQKVEVDGAADFASLHDKFSVSDDARVMTGSLNWSVTGLTQNHEHLLTIQGGGFPAKYERAFQDIAAGRTASAAYDADAGLNVQFGPADRLDSTVIRRIRAARRSIYVAMFDLGQRAIIDELLAARRRGVRVVLIVDRNQAEDPAQLLDDMLECGGQIVDGGVRCADGGPSTPVLRANTGSIFVKMHQKYSIYDEEFVIAGSYNWTNLATYYNHENIVEIRSPRIAQRFLGNFVEILQRFDPTYTTATTPPARYGFTTGDVQVTFEVPEPRLRSGDTILLAPDPQTMGTGGARAMTRRSDGVWELTMTAPAGRMIEYKFLVRDRFGELHWEAGPKHFYTPVFGVAQQRWSDVFRDPPEGP